MPDPSAASSEGRGSGSGTGAGGSVRDVLRDSRLNHRVEVIAGVRGEECGAVLREFFEARRGAPGDGDQAGDQAEDAVRDSG